MKKYNDEKYILCKLEELQFEPLSINATQNIPIRLYIRRGQIIQENCMFRSDSDESGCVLGDRMVKK